MSSTATLSSDLEGYAKGCQLLAYGNNLSVDSVFVLLNDVGVGKPNPVSQLLCAKVKPCPPGTYELPGTQSNSQPQCADCEIGYFQPDYGQPWCKPCKGGFYGVKPGTISAADGCRPCPSGTYKSDTIGACSVCTPGTASQGLSMDRCDACPGPNATGSCSGGAAVPYTDAQLAVVQKLLPPSSKSTLEERQCQAQPARFVRTAGTSDVDGAANPKGRLSPAVLGPAAVFPAAAIIVLLLHRFIPEWLWSNIDFTAQFHKVPQCGASVKENTPLGCAFTLAFVFLTPALGILLHALNEQVEANSLVPPKGGTFGTNLRIQLGLPAGNPFGNDASYCAGIAYVNESLWGMTCEGGSLLLDSECIILLTGCRFNNPSARLRFSVPWFERFVSWSISVNSTVEAAEHQLSGVVTSGDAASLVWPKKEVLVAIQAQPASLNDTINANLNRNGFLLSHLPCVPPVAINTTEGWHLMGSDLAWQLTLELRLSPTLYETVRTMKQGPMELAISIFTTVMAVMGVWKTFFTHVEGPVSALRMRLTRRRQMPREGRPSGVELQPNDRVSLLATVISNLMPVDSDALTALKLERKLRQDSDEELHEMMVRMTKQQEQQDKKIEQQHEAIRKLTEKFEQMTQE